MIVKTPFFISPAYCGAEDDELAALEAEARRWSCEVMPVGVAGWPGTGPALKIT